MSKLNPFMNMKKLLTALFFFVALIGAQAQENQDNTPPVPQLYEENTLEENTGADQYENASNKRSASELDKADDIVTGKTEAKKKPLKERLAENLISKRLDKISKRIEKNQRASDDDLIRILIILAIVLLILIILGALGIDLLWLLLVALLVVLILWLLGYFN